MACDPRADVRLGIHRDALTSVVPLRIYEVAPAWKLMALTGTTGYRPDVNATFGIPGNHGWSTTFSSPTGSFRFCAWAINVGPGTNTMLGCSSVVVPHPSAPTGHLDSVTVSHSTVTITGWSLDPDDLVDPEPVHIWEPGYVQVGIHVGPTRFSQLWAYTATRIHRGDVNVLLHTSGNHGWSITFAISPGPHTLCAWGINVGFPASNTQLGCRSVATQREELAWGYNGCGKLGDGTQVAYRDRPAWAYGIPKVKQVAGDAYQSSILLSSDGTVWGTGCGEWGQLGPAGLGTAPFRIPNLSGITQMAASVRTPPPRDRISSRRGGSLRDCVASTALACQLGQPRS